MNVTIVNHVEKYFLNFTNKELSQSDGLLNQILEEFSWTAEKLVTKAQREEQETCTTKHKQGTLVNWEKWRELWEKL